MRYQNQYQTNTWNEMKCFIKIIYKMEHFMDNNNSSNLL